MAVTKEYLDFQDKSELEYPGTVVLIEIGKFYEIYSYFPDEDVTNTDENSRQIGHSRDVGSVLGYEVVLKSSSRPHSRTNPYMMGFPSGIYNIVKKQLLSLGYRIIRYDQIKGKNGIERHIGEIATADTDIEAIINKDSELNNIVCIYIECQQSSNRWDEHIIACGLSLVNLSNGTCIVTENYSINNNTRQALQEAYRFIVTNRPKEIIITISDIKTEDKEHYQSEIIKWFKLYNYLAVDIRFDDVSKEARSIPYQKAFLSKIYDRNPQVNLETLFGQDFNNNASIEKFKIVDINETILTRLNLSFYKYGIVSFIYLLTVCYNKTPDLISTIRPPVVSWSDEDKHLILTHNSLDQLDIVDNSLFSMGSNKITNKRLIKPKPTCLLKVIDNTRTSDGKAFLISRLVNPITNVIELNKCYNVIDELHDLDLTAISAKLGELKGLRALVQKLKRSIIKPRELANLFDQYKILIDLITIIVNSGKQNIMSLLPHFKDDKFESIFNQCLSYAYSRIDFNKIKSVSCRLSKRTLDSFKANESFLLVGVSTEIDICSNSLTETRTILNEICDYFNSLLAGKRGRNVTINITVKDGIETAKLETTPSKGKFLVGCDLDENICGELQLVSNVKSTIILSSDIIDTLCENYVYYREQMNNMTERLYNEVIENIISYDVTHYITDFVAELDYLHSNAITAKKYNYNRPTIIEDRKGYLDIKNMRHPLCERIEKTKYISNDILLDTSKENGMILFGVNASGKSSLTKATALNLIMAQAGMFVPSNMTYSIFKRIITRLSGNDSLLDGKSSFDVEMTELLTALEYASEDTLVLGDELCKGTDSKDGTAITVSSINVLIKANSPFIFSTHNHNLTEMKDIIKHINDNKLLICHLTIKEDGDSFIYDRKLTPGQGLKSYGLMVCKKKGFSDAFIEDAVRIRREIEGTSDKILDERPSKYNNEIYYDKCLFCYSDDDLHIHHLAEQHLADDNGFIENTHKNTAYNLVTLCKNCHQKIHSYNIHLKRVKQSDGVMITQD